MILRTEVKGKKGNHTQRVLVQMIDRRDLQMGFTAMSRTVGYTASIGAQMIATGKITKRGVLTPVNDVPCIALKRELAKREIRITREVVASYLPERFLMCFHKMPKNAISGLAHLGCCLPGVLRLA